jgi:hypothetical protein
VEDLASITPSACYELTGTSHGPAGAGVELAFRGQFSGLVIPQPSMDLEVQEQDDEQTEGAEGLNLWAVTG